MFSKIQYDAKRKILSDLGSDISSLGLHNRTFEVNKRVFETSVIEPALRLHEDMCFSIPQYRTEIPRGGLDISWTLKDITTWREVKKPGETKDGVYCLYPAIVQRGGGDKDQKVLVKPVGIVNLPLAASTESVAHEDDDQISHNRRQRGTPDSRFRFRPRTRWFRWLER